MAENDNAWGKNKKTETASDEDLTLPREDATVPASQDATVPEVLERKASVATRRVKEKKVPFVWGEKPEAKAISSVRGKEEGGELWRFPYMQVMENNVTCIS